MRRRGGNVGKPGLHSPARFQASAPTPHVRPRALASRRERRHGDDGIDSAPTPRDDSGTARKGGSCPRGDGDAAIPTEVSALPLRKNRIELIALAGKECLYPGLAGGASVREVQNAVFYFVLAGPERLPFTGTPVATERERARSGPRTMKFLPRNADRRS